MAKKKSRKQQFNFNSASAKVKEIKDLYKKGDKQRALVEVKNLLERYPKEYNLLFALGNFLAFDTHFVKEGKEILESLLNTNYYHPTRVYLALGELYTMQGEFDEAKKQIRPLVGTSKNTSALKNLAVIDYELNDIKNGREKFKKIYENPWNKDTYFAKLTQAKMESYLGNYEVAEKLFDEIIDSNFNLKYEAMRYKGRMMTICGEYEIAREYFEMLPEYDSFKKIEIIHSLIHEKNYQKALIETRSVLSKNKYIVPDFLVFYLTYLLGLVDKNKHLEFYSDRQLVSYDNGRTLEHIQSHFDEQIAKTVLEDVNSIIGSINPYDYNQMDRYVIRLDRQYPTKDGWDSDLFEVITLPTTKKVITVYPVKTKFLRAYGQSNKDLSEIKER